MRRLHSIFGLWLVIYLIMHLFTNSQAALWLGDDGKGFIKAVNDIHNLPYLKLIEIAILGLPIFFHAGLGIEYILNAKYNSFGSHDGSVPYLPAYPRNHAYTWQRITSWLLLIGIVAHIAHMRFYEYPTSARMGNQHLYLVKLDEDPGLTTVADRLDTTLYTRQQIYDQQKVANKQSPQSSALFDQALQSISSLFKPDTSLERGGSVSAQQREFQEQFIHTLHSIPLKNNQVVAVAPDFGTAELLMLRDTFKSPVLIVLYTLFVLTACFHAFNGLWTFMISWGVTLTVASQRIMRTICTALMVVVAALGLAAIWLTYWVNLWQ